MIRRLFAGFGISSFTVLVTLVGQIVTVPVILQQWGTQTYGEWLTLTGIATTFTILNLGVQSYVGNLLIECYVKKDYETGNRIISAALRLYLVLCSGIIFLLILIVTQVSFIEVFKLHSISLINARIIIFIQGLSVAYSILGGILFGLLRASQQVPRQLAYGLIERIAILGTPVVVALLGGTPLQVTLAITLIMGIIAIIALRDIWQRSPFRITLNTSTWRQSFALIPPSTAFLGVTLVSTVLSSGVVIILAMGGGGNAVTLFSTTLMLTNFVRILLSQGLNVFWPEITAAKIAGTVLLSDWYIFTIKVLVTVGGIATLGIALLGTSALRVWTGDEVIVDHLLNILLAAYLLVQLPAFVTRTFGLALNRARDVVRLDIWLMIMTIVFSLPLTSLFGVRGMAIALLLGQLINTGQFLRQIVRWIDIPAQELPQSNARGILFCFVVAVGCGLGALMGDDITLRCAILVALVIVSLLWTWCAWFTETERERLRQTMSLNLLVLFKPEVR